MSGDSWADFRERLLAGQPLDLCAQRPLLERRLPELAALGRRGQDVLRHTQEVLDRLQPQLRSLPSQRAQALRLAALLHELDRTPSAAAALARTVLFRLQLPGPLRDQVVHLVRRHRVPASFGGREAALGRMLRLAWTLDTDALYRLAAAHLEAAGVPVSDRRAQRLAAFRARCHELGILGREPAPLLSRRSWQALAPADPALRRRLAGELRFLRLKGRVQTPEQARDWLAAQSPQPAATLYLPVGVPGSGKSTWITTKARPARMVSMDVARERLTGTRADQSRNREIYHICRRELAQALRAGESVAWDAQSHTWSARQGLLALARETHAYVIIVYFDLPLAVALERNTRRELMVPEETIRRSYQDLQEPRPFEAEEIWRVDAEGHCVRYVADEDAGA